MNDAWDKLTARIEHGMEALIFASRWLLAPFYIGLAASIVVLLIKFMAELWHIASHAFTSTESEVILGVLSLVDLALTGSLLIIVIFSGYENFVSKVDHSGHKDWPEWMGTIDFAALKLKLLSSIVAISAIQLLKQFMALKSVSDRDLMWLVIIHVVFVVSSVFLALSDRIAGHGSHGADAKGGGHGGGGNGGGHKSTDPHPPADKGAPPIMVAKADAAADAARRAAAAVVETTVPSGSNRKLH